MRSFLFRLSLDTTGFWASAICALHCVAVPILLSFTTFSSLAFLEHETIEYAILGASAALGVVSLLPSYVRHHRKFNALLILLAGFMLILFGRFVDITLYEVLLTSLGALLVAFAHAVNFRMCKVNHHQDI